MRKLRLREVKSFGQGHMASKWQTQRKCPGLERKKKKKEKKKKKKGLNVSLKPVGVGGLIQRRARRAPEVWETGGLLPAPRAVWRCQGRNPAPGDWGSR